jgi:predicted nucleic acid-binding protein
MILVDTSVWIDHLRKSDVTLFHLLRQRHVLTHPLIIDEIAVWSFKNRSGILTELGLLPIATVAEHEEVLHFISHHRLHGLGIGYIDAHLLAAVQLTPGATLWTRDKRLATVAEALKLAFDPSS